MIKRHLIPALVIALGISGAVLSTAAFADASVSEPMLIDASVDASGSGSAVTTTTTTTTTTVAPLPDPEASPLESASTIYKLYKSGGLVPAIIVGLFMLLTVLARKLTWLQEGNRALAVAGVLGALAILVEPAARGTTPNLSMILAALGAGIALALNPKKPSTSEAK